MPVLIKGAAQVMQTERSQVDVRTAQGWFAQQKGGRACDRLVRFSGANRNDEMKPQTLSYRDSTYSQFTRFSTNAFR